MQYLFCQALLLLVCDLKWLQISKTCWHLILDFTTNQSVNSQPSSKTAVLICLFLPSLSKMHLVFSFVIEIVKICALGPTFYENV